MFPYTYHNYQALKSNTSTCSTPCRQCNQIFSLIQLSSSMYCNSLRLRLQVQYVEVVPVLHRRGPSHRGGPCPSAISQALAAGQKREKVLHFAPLAPTFVSGLCILCCPVILRVRWCLILTTHAENREKCHCTRVIIFLNDIRTNKRDICTLRTSTYACTLAHTHS